MDLLVAITNYLREHWTVANVTPRDRHSDVGYYATLPDPYGPVFAAKLKSNLHKELEAKA